MALAPDAVSGEPAVALFMGEVGLVPLKMLVTVVVAEMRAAKAVVFVSAAQGAVSRFRQLATDWGVCGEGLGG